MIRALESDTLVHSCLSGLEECMRGRPHHASAQPLPTGRRDVPQLPRVAAMQALLKDMATAKMRTCINTAV